MDAALDECEGLGLCLGSAWGQQESKLKLPSGAGKPYLSLNFLRGVYANFIALSKVLASLSLKGSGLQI
jgi:hypothetical protein